MKPFLMSVMALVLGLSLGNAVEAKNSKGGGKSRSSGTVAAHRRPGHSRAAHHPKHRGSNKRLTATGKGGKRKSVKGASAKGSRRLKGKYGKGASTKGSRRVKGKYGKGVRGRGVSTAKGKGWGTKGGRLKSGKGRKLSARDRARIRRAHHKFKNARARKALRKLARGEGLDPEELDDLEDELDELDDELDDDEEEAIQAGVSAAQEALLEAAGSNEEEAETETDFAEETEAAPPAVKQTQRYLRVANATGKTLSVYVQYRTRTPAGQFAWLPADPRTSQEAVAIEIPAGEAVDLADGDVRTPASRVRLWAEPGPKKWAQYQLKDLWLVPEKGEQGDHYYFAEEMKTFTYTFRP
jgi:hypothetical protein